MTNVNMIIPCIDIAMVSTLKENATNPMCYTVNAVFDAPAQAPVTHSLPTPVI